MIFSKKSSEPNRPFIVYKALFLKPNNLKFATNQIIMKRKSLFFAAFLLGSISLGIQSCTKDPCENVVCQNGGVSEADGEDCLCDCEIGYEGDRCETEERAKFLATYTVSERQNLGTPYSFTASIVSVSADVTKVALTGFSDGLFASPIIATISGTSIIIANQDPDSDGYIVSGSGTISNTTITLQFTITGDDGSGNIVTDDYQSQWTKL